MTDRVGDLLSAVLSPNMLASVLSLHCLLVLRLHCEQFLDGAMVAMLVSDLECRSMLVMRGGVHAVICMIVHVGISAACVTVLTIHCGHRLCEMLEHRCIS